MYRLAAELGCGGHVLNDARGVVVEVEADDRVGASASWRGCRPRRRRWRRSSGSRSSRCRSRASAASRSAPARPAASPRAAVSADTATCDDCLAELFDPADRRHRYPFVNCTNCGPRFTIVRGVPYDRPLTTMAGFDMCAACRPSTTTRSTAASTPSPTRARSAGRRRGSPGRRRASDAVAAAAAALLGGAIVAVKGVGGFHLACRADDEAAVAALRARKHREDKPFALMAPTWTSARALVELGAGGGGAARLAARGRSCWRAGAPDAAVAAAVAPRSPELGVMLPYSPLHHLLLADVGAPLVMTSGNVSDEPIAYRDDDALERLAGDRRPASCSTTGRSRPAPTTRSCAWRRRRRPLLLRRSRGYVPGQPRAAASRRRHVLACGAELKNTFCVAKGERAWVGHHIGDLAELRDAALVRRRASRTSSALFAVEPEVVAHDLHPEYLSTKFALELRRSASRGRAAPPRAPGRLPGRARRDRARLGAIYDGTGYGTDGTRVGRRAAARRPGGFERVGPLLAGADARRRGGDPPALADGVRVARGRVRHAAALPATLAAGGPDRWGQVAGLARSGLASPAHLQRGPAVRRGGGAV